MTKGYFTARSDDGLLLPYSGRILGAIAEALRIKAELDVLGAGDKTTQRYFAGILVDPVNVQRILDAAVAAFVPNDIPLSVGVSPPDATFPELVRAALGHYVTLWDRVAGEVNEHRYPVPAGAGGDLPLGPLRLALLDIGLRWGAWSALQGVDLMHPQSAEPWWSDKAVGLLIDRHRPGRRPTVDKLADKCKVTAQTIDSWRSGKASPSNLHLKRLARALGTDDLERRRLEYQLRLVVGATNLRKALSRQCGTRRIDDMLWALQRTAALVSHNVGGTIRLLLGDEADLVRAQSWEVVLLGARSELGARLCGPLAETAVWSPEVAADFQALPAQWVERCRYWLHLLGSRGRETENLRGMMEQGQFPGLNDLGADKLTSFAIDHALRMRNFDFKPGDDQHMVVIKNPPKQAAANRVVQADRAMSAGDADTAIMHMRHAVKHQPLEPVLHFKLGGMLGTRASHGHPEDFDEALFEVRLAVEIDPEFGNARNEIGVILSNMWRRAEAEVAFAEAELYHGFHAHHWFGRANNLVGLGRLDDAVAAYEKAIERSADQDHVHAVVYLAQTLMALGREKEARRWFGKVRNRVPEAVLDRWQEFLNGWQRRREVAR